MSLVGALVLIAMTVGGFLFVVVAFRCPNNCPKGGKHEWDWDTLKPTLGGWSVLTCNKCGEKEIA